jgi:hypothetical protein
MSDPDTRRIMRGIADDYEKLAKLKREDAKRPQVIR